MKTCQHCGAQIHFEGGPENEPSYPYVWVDNSGGDVCGWDGANAPHEPADTEAWRNWLTQHPDYARFI